MEDIFGEEINEDIEAFEDENNEENPAETGEPNEDDKDEDDKKDEKKPKRIIRNPRATLNAERLKGPKGLCAVEPCFEKVKYKGKGHEEEDLDTMLKTYQYWCHRLFPKFAFEDCVRKIETLGVKGPIVTYMKKSRMGMLDEEQLQTADPENLPDFNSDDETNAQPTTQDARNQDIINDIPVELTEEQLETIRKNKEKAQQLRMERMKTIQAKAAVYLPCDDAQLTQNEEENLRLAVENSEPRPVPSETNIVQPLDMETARTERSHEDIEETEDEMIGEIEELPAIPARNEDNDDDDEAIVIRKKKQFNLIDSDEDDDDM